MSFFSSIFHTILYQPLFNALVFLYDYVPGKDFGIAIILLTFLLRFAMYPLSANAFKAQKALAEIQPKVKEIQEQHKGDKGEISRRTLELYKTEGFNPFSAFLPILLQLPILIALYQVFINGLNPDQLSILYPFVPNPLQFNHSFLGILSLSEKSLAVAVLAGAFQLIQSKQALMLAPQQKKGQAKANDAASMVQSQMVYIFPLFTVFLVAQFPSAIGLYWIATSIFSVGQQWYLMKTFKNAGA